MIFRLLAENEEHFINHTRYLQWNDSSNPGFCLSITSAVTYEDHTRLSTNKTKYFCGNFFY